MSVHVEPSVTVSANVGPDRPDPRQVLHGPPALKANCTKIGGPLAGVTVAIRVVGLTLLITPVIVFSSFAAQATAAINSRPTAAPVATVLFVFIIVFPTLTRPRRSATFNATLERFLVRSGEQL